MHSHQLEVRVGDRVVISRPDSRDSFAPRIERESTVEAVRPNHSMPEASASGMTEESGMATIDFA